MIIEPRKIELSTSDQAPAIGDVVLVYPLPDPEAGTRSRITRVIAHWPALGPLGAWSVEIVGIRKPLRTALVTQADDSAHVWREIGGR